MALLIELLQCIKRAAREAVEADVPAAPCIGVVVAEEPLNVRLNQRLTLPGKRFLFLEGQKKPEAGDRLALLSFAGGQTYLVLGWLKE